MDKNAKKILYEAAEIQVIKFCISDVLTTSSTDIEESLPDGTWQ